jgi:SlyX protein
MSPATADENSPDDRYIALEERLAFQQRMLEELNTVVVSQQGELDRLRREVSRLGEASRVLMERTGDNLPHEKPPHY